MSHFHLLHSAVHSQHEISILTGTYTLVDLVPNRTDEVIHNVTSHAVFHHPQAKDEATALVNCIYIKMVYTFIPYSVPFHVYTHEKGVNRGAAEMDN